eukprot:gene5199-8803_t
MSQQSAKVSHLEVAGTTEQIRDEQDRITKRSKNGDSTQQSRHILITGSPGTGKSTLISRLAKELQAKGVCVKGFWTEEIREDKSRIGFDIVTFDGKRRVLSRVGSPGPRVGKYGVHVKDFEDLAVPCLLSSTSTSGTVIIIDEIGKMELFSQKFITTYRQLLNSCPQDTLVLSTIAQRGAGFIAEIKDREDAVLYTITRKDRDTKFEVIKTAVFERLHLPH